MATTSRTIRKIKVVGGPRRTLTTSTSLLIVFAVAALAFILWRVWGVQETPTPVQRTIREFRLTYRCPAGHVFQAPGQLAACPCPECGRPAWPVDNYYCPDHGDFEVEVQLRPAADGRPHVGRIRLPGGPWHDVGEGLVCPRCKKPLRRGSADPILHRKPVQP